MGVLQFPADLSTSPLVCLFPALAHRAKLNELCSKEKDTS